MFRLLNVTSKNPMKVVVLKNTHGAHRYTFENEAALRNYVNENLSRTLKLTQQAKIDYLAAEYLITLHDEHGCAVPLGILNDYALSLLSKRNFAAARREVAGGVKFYSGLSYEMSYRGVLYLAGKHHAQKLQRPIGMLNTYRAARRLQRDTTINDLMKFAKNEYDLKSNLVTTDEFQHHDRMAGLKLMDSILFESKKKTLKYHALTLRWNDLITQLEKGEL